MNRTPAHRPIGPRARAWLALALLGVLALPWLAGAWIKTGLQPGLADDAAREAMRVDFLVAGTTVFGLAMLVVVTFGCWIVGVMKGPQRTADSYPTERTDTRETRP